MNSLPVFNEGGHDRELGFRVVQERPAAGDVPFVRHPEWMERFPWLVQGTTTSGSGTAPFDLALNAEHEADRVHARWEALKQAMGAERVHYARQVHGSVVHFHETMDPGLHLAPPADGHVSRTPGSLLAVTIADCVPVTLVDERTRAVASIHAGWRGLADGVLDSGWRVLREQFETEPGALHVHLGPSICGSCYEVGPEVFEGLGLSVPACRTPVDLRLVGVRQVLAWGVAGENVTVSSWCTLCDGSPFFSHRGGHRGRQVSFVGLMGSSGGRS